MKRELWTLVIDIGGGTYIRQFDVQSIEQILHEMSKESVYPENSIRTFSHEWVPVDGVTSVMCTGGLTEEDESFLIHAVLTSR